ncbi:MAG: beta-ketoacyl synthase N-terminal-like domain-containing protein, partial [Candidatus Solibacter sp.]
MEVIWQSIEDSGHHPEDFAGARTALFVSSLSDDYKKLLQDADIGLNGFYWMGNETAMFPAKIALFLNIQGPCQFLNAECSSGLFALHEASGM